MIPQIHIEDFSYPLPDERIAKYPLEERDASKLLIYRDGQVGERKFRNLAEELPAGCLMIFNDTKVVPARLFFRRATGAHVEIFCLDPDDPAEYNTNFAATERCRWKCVIGNAKRLKAGEVLRVDVAPTDRNTNVPHTNRRGDYSRVKTCQTARNTVYADESQLILPVEKQ